MDQMMTQQFMGELQEFVHKAQRFLQENGGGYGQPDITACVRAEAREVAPAAVQEAQAVALAATASARCHGCTKACQDRDGKDSPTKAGEAVTTSQTSTRATSCKCNQRGG